jgi:hypothetical protein
MFMRMPLSGDPINREAQRMAARCAHALATPGRWDSGHGAREHQALSMNTRTRLSHSYQPPANGSAEPHAPCKQGPKSLKKDADIANQAQMRKET